MVERLWALPDGPLGQEDLLVPEFLVAHEGRVRVFWIPFERVNRDARIAIIGLTPGWYQMQQAFTVARDALRSGITDEIAVLEAVERHAGFAGSMRANMVQILTPSGCRPRWASGPARRSLSRMIISSAASPPCATPCS